MNRYRTDISVGRLLTAGQCLRKLYLTMTTRVAPDKRRVTGDLVHSTIAPTPESTESAKRKLDRLPVTEQQEVKAAVAEIAAAYEELKDEELTPDGQEHQMHWLFRRSGWTVYARPDELFFFSDILQNRVMQLTETKAMALEAKRSHWDQLYTFAVVAALFYNAKTDESWYRGPIKLVLRLPRVAALKKQGVESIELENGRVLRVADLREEHVKWYSPKSTRERVDAIEDLLGWINNAFQTDEFPPCPGGYCHGCPFREQCPEGQQFLNPTPPQPVEATAATTQRVPLVVLAPQQPLGETA